MNILFVAGTWNDQGGENSGYAQKLIGEFIIQEKPDGLRKYNGGHYGELENIDVRPYDVVIWMANVPNDKPKFVRKIKEINPHCVLVTSKRNLEGKYSTLQLLAGALQTKSNLLIEITDCYVGENPAAIYGGTILDPLGNCFANKVTSVPILVCILRKRISQLQLFTRVSSECAGEKIEPLDNLRPPLFFNLARKYAQVYHDIIHADTTRFLGNLSFRCEEGFPSFRSDFRNVIYVSKRNIDKQEIDSSGFVCVQEENGVVKYWGQNKPSVDTPIQLALYARYKKINYMFHSHVYVENSPMTKHIVPCGALQEVEEISQLVPSTCCNWFFVNLRGHGSLCASEDVDILRNIPYVPRPIPEMAQEEGEWPISFVGVV